MRNGIDADTARRPAPAVAFLAGSGRSGSTLLERTLGAVPGYVNIGEALDLPRRVAPHDELCGCGMAFSSCPFWTSVGTAFDGWAPSWLEETHRLQASVARQRRLPRLLAPRLGKEYAAHLTEYAGRYGALYQRVAEVSGSDVVVDASKWPTLALALWRGGIDVRVIHLLRDVRGVAFSLNKAGVERPHAAQGDVMYRNRPVHGAARWLATQTEVDVLAARGVPVARIRYADFVGDPGPAVRAALEQLELPVPPGGLAHIDGHSVELGPSHGLSGNPSRFTHGRLTLHPDEQWRTQMAPRDRILTAAIGLPQLVRYGYVTRAVQRPTVADPATEPSEWPLVSVVVPTCNRPDMVREAISSVVAQTYPGEIECIVVHDRESPEPALSELGRPGRAVQVISNTRSEGLAGARNTGLEIVKGAFVASLDDDDRWHRTKVEKQVRRFLAEPDILMLGTGIRLLLPNHRTADWPGRASHIPRDLLLRNRVKELHSSTLMMRRDAFAKAGQYDEGLPHGYGEDWDLVLRVSRVGKIGVVRQPLADIRKDGQSYYIGQAERTVVALQTFLEKHPEVAADRRGHARMLGQLAFQHACLGHRSDGLRLAARAMSRWPLSPHPYVALAQLATGLDPARMRRLARRLGRGMA